jgi:hypothetical protein
MTTKEKTLTHLRHLEALYRRGYRSDVVDRSLDKVLALEKETARRELKELQERLRAFEAQYQLSSQEFYQRFRAGELGDAVDFVEWSIFYEMAESVRERLEALEAEAA